MKEIKEFLLPDHTNQLYQKEAISSIALTKAVAEKINELVRAYNTAFSDNLTKQHEQDGKIRKAVLYMKDNLLNSMNDLMVTLRDSGFIDSRIEYHCQYLKNRLDNLLGSVKEGTTSLDAELIDIRTGADGVVSSNAGESIRRQFESSVRGLGRIDKSTKPDLNGLETNTIYHIADWTGMLNLPVNKVGACITLSSDNVGRGLQLYSTNTGELYYRIFWAPVNGEKTFKEWKSTDFTSDIEKCVKGSDYIVEGDLNEAPVNRIISVTDWTNVKNLPVQSVGTVTTFSSDDEGKRGYQTYVTKEGATYHRAFWTISTGEKSFSKWNAEKPFPNVLIPETIYGVVGQELPLYYCQMFDCLEWKSEIAPTFTYNGTGAKGYDDRISIIPEEAGTFTLNIKMHKVIDGVNVTTANYPVTVKVTAGSISSSSKALFLGDSRTDFARICKFPVSSLGNKVEFIGTLSENGINHEGRSGWTAEGYCTLSERKGVSNPFWDGSKFNFTRYMNNNGFTGVEYVNLLFGVNSLYSDNAPNYIEEIINSIHEYDSNIKVTVMTEYVLPFSAYYSGSFHRCTLGRAFFRKICDKFKNRENENIFILASNLVIDDYFDWKKIAIPVSQYSTETVEVIEDNIHPKESGYNKIGAIWTAFYLNDKAV